MHPLNGRHAARGRGGSCELTGWWAVLHRVCFGYAFTVNCAFLMLGFMFASQALQIGALMESAGVEQDGVQGFQEAVLLICSVVTFPFFEDAGSLGEMPQASIPVVGFWLPFMLAGLFITTFALGQSTLRARSACSVLQFAFASSVFLTWAVEIGQTLSHLAQKEEFTFAEDQTHLIDSQVIPYTLFKESYETFAHFFDEAKCTSEIDGAAASVRCGSDSLEARMVEAIVLNVCKSKSLAPERIEDRGKRVETCKLQGRQLSILPSKVASRETTYCHCRAAFYDIFRATSRWVRVVWLAEFLGVCLILYFGVEPHLARQGAKARREILGVASIGVVALPCWIYFGGGANLDRLSMQD